MKPEDLFCFYPSPARFFYASDKPVAELGFVEQLTVWALRVQWPLTGDRGRRHALLQRTFHLLQVPEGGALITAIVEALRTTTSRPLSVPCPGWRVLTSDEARLLSFLAALQQREGTPLAACEPEWRTGEQGTAIWQPAQRLALAFAAAGLHFGTARLAEQPTPLSHASLH